METIKSKQARTQQAESGIQLLKQAIELGSKNKIIEAMEYLEEDDSFNWDDLDVIFMEWDELIDEAHEILYYNGDK